MRLPAIEFWHDDRERLCAALMVTEKYGESRFVYAGSPASQSLEEWIAERPKTDHDQLFVSLGGRSYGHPLCLISIQHVMRKLRTQAGIAKDTPAHAHGFRHAFAIRMLDHGHDLAAVAAWLGHADPAFTAKVYVRRREDELRRKFFGG
jgi:integrase